MASDASRSDATAALAKLCDLCANFTRAFEEKSINYGIPGFIESKGYRTGDYAHHGNFADLDDAALGCSLCKTFRLAIFANHVQSTEGDVRRAQAALDARGSRMFNVSVTHYSEATPASNYGFRGFHYSAVSRDTGHTIDSTWLSVSMNDGSPAYIDGRKLHAEWDAEFFQAHISTCMTDNAECSQDTGLPLPTRLLYLGGGSDVSSVNLISSKGMSGNYLALSYCWGASTPYCTEKATLVDRMRAIDYDELPRIYQDAIRVAKRLGIRYLWVDALCIVQDDIDDWQRESAQMGAIYERAALVINAPAASSANEAMLQSRSEAASCSVPVAWKAGQPSGTATVALADPKHELLLIEGPDCALNTRAWVFQEHMLAARTLTFGSCHIYLSCKRHVVFESSKTATPLHLIRNPTAQPETETPLDINLLTRLPNGVSAHRVWYQFLVHYTARYMSYENDKLPAITGIAQRFSKHLPGDQYVAGLWVNDLVNGLAWLRFDFYRDQTHHKHSRHARTVPMPTWSWASSDRHVGHADVHGQPEVSMPLVDIVSVDGIDIEYSEASRKRSSILSVHGNLIPCTGEKTQPAGYLYEDGISTASAYDENGISIGSGNHSLSLAEPYACAARWVHDTEEEQQPRTTAELAALYILPLLLAIKQPTSYSSVPKVTGYPAVRALVLKHSHFRAGAFERVGFALIKLNFPTQRWASAAQFVDWVRQPSQRTLIDLV